MLCKMMSMLHKMFYRITYQTSDIRHHTSDTKNKIHILGQQGRGRMAEPPSEGRRPERMYKLYSLFIKNLQCQVLKNIRTDARASGPRLGARPCGLAPVVPRHHISYIIYHISYIKLCCQNTRCQKLQLDIKKPKKLIHF